MNFLLFSGGLTSGYMLRREIDRVGIEEYKRMFTTIFCNTGKEHDKTLDFVHAVETKWGVPITWLQYTRIKASEINPEHIPAGRKRTNLASATEKGLDAHWFDVVNYETASRYAEANTPFDKLLAFMSVVPNVRVRACSGQLKIRTKCRYIHSLGIREWNDYIGIRKDEEHRALEIIASPEDKGEHPRFPLCEDNQTKRDVESFWSANNFTLEIPNHEGNCGGCFLKSKWKRRAFARNNPKAAQWWADKQAEIRARGVSGTGAQFVKGEDWEDIIREAGQPDLFEDRSEEDVACSCAVGGYRDNESDLFL